MIKRHDRRRRTNDHMLDAACAELHGKLMNLGQYPMTTMEYLASWEFGPIVLAARRAGKTRDRGRDGKDEVRMDYIASSIYIESLDEKNP